jgi:hypothetical protein
MASQPLPYGSKYRFESPRRLMGLWSEVEEGHDSRIRGRTAVISSGDIGDRVRTN